MSKKILGLDLGTNSIGWALVNQDFENKTGEIVSMGSRIIPMSQDILGEFGKGNSVSQTAERTGFRSARKLRERHLLRRERLHRVLNVLGFLPEHYAQQIDFETRLGKFFEETEPKLAYQKVSNPKTEKQEFDFIFKKSFREMLEDFKIQQPQFLTEGKLIPYDWTIYFLRKKALTQKIEKEELAWILLNFNQKRGYYQLRGEEDEENPNKLVEFHSLNVVEVRADEPQKGNAEIWYSLILENGWVYRRSSKTPLFDWNGKVRDFIVTTELTDSGAVKTNKEGEVKRSFRAPKEDDWTLVKEKTQKEIKYSKKTVGSYIYDALLQNPQQKIKGKLVRTIERKFYKDELKAILIKQKEFHLELQNDNLYHDCIRELYRNNKAHQFALSKKDSTHLFIDDIIFYQRPLKSKKSSIGNCTLEFKKYKVNGEEKTEYLKAISKSNPIYQEFRMWQWLYNLCIYKREDDTNVTNEFLSTIQDYESLFEFLNNRIEIKQEALIKYLMAKRGLKGKTLTSEVAKYRWNFVDDKEKGYPCNETKTQLLSRLSKVKDVPKDFLTPQMEQQLWHLIYSVTDKREYEQSLKTFAIKNKLDVESFVENFKKFPPFKSEYGAFSEKAIKKLLPLMRIGKYWKENDISRQIPEYQKNINSLLGNLKDKEERINELDNKFKKTINQSFKTQLQQFEDGNLDAYQGIPLHLASYLVYCRHSEAANAGKWNTVADLENYLAEFRQHSLRNPIVEQVITETLRVVKDIWAKYGNGSKDFFDEIHIELGRELKSTADERNSMTKRITENENTNLRIKALLIELMNDDSNIKPYSPTQQEILKIYEDGIINSNIEIPDDIGKISKKSEPSNAELQRYKLWLDQKYRSPYTGLMIPLNKLFTTEYEIEHIIPQSCYFDDSISNKVICESAINKLKDNQLGLAFIKNHHGAIVETGFGRTAKVLEVVEYEAFVKENYTNNRAKRNKLLMEEIPEKMIDRQMNDTRYISKFIAAVLSNIVRADTNDDGINSKNIIPGNGKITSILKQDWGLNDVWNELILPRFERLNTLTNSTHFTAWNQNHQKFLPTVPFELSKGFQKKRIDHRHHALDALIIACATRGHVNLLNNQSAGSGERYDLNRKLRKFEKVVYNHPRTGEKIEREVPKDFIKPWHNFTVDARNSLESIIVSFKQNLRVINKTTNKYEKWCEKDGLKTKALIHQNKGDSWAIRKPLHKETVSGIVDLKRIKLPKGKILTATRKPIDATFDLKRIESITDTGIQKILKNYLSAKGNNPEIAFSPEGIEDMNRNIEKYNAGMQHQPILKARIFELGSKFQLGQSGNKQHKYVEAAKGTNLFFAIYQDSRGKRNYDSIPLNIVIEQQKNGLSPVPEINEKGDTLLFHLSPNDLIYVPTEEEKDSPELIMFENLTKAQVQRIYKVVSFSGNQCFLINQNVATSIVNKVEFSALNKMEKSIDGQMIKDICIKLRVERLGNIIAINNNSINKGAGIKNILSEPAVAYKKSSITTFNSFEEMNKADAQSAAHTAPLDHLKNTTERIKKIYADELKTPFDKKIKRR